MNKGRTQDSLCVLVVNKERLVYEHGQKDLLSTLSIYGFVPPANKGMLLPTHKDGRQPLKVNYQLTTVPCYHVSMTNSSSHRRIPLHKRQWFCIPVGTNILILNKNLNSVHHHHVI